MAPEVRPVEPRDLPEVLALLTASLGWVPDDQHEAFFRWKHVDNPFGASPAWVAVDDGRILGFRTFLRWELRRDGTVLRAVRAVDTATHPDAQGRGLFRLLTTHALDEVRAEGVDFVFNTPNDQSRPGYLKMGWADVGRLPIRMRPRSLASLVRMGRARRPADKWSLATDAGVPAADVLADTDAVGALLAALGDGPPGAVRTNRSAAHLRWRYGFEPLRYRAVPLDGSSAAGGLVLFRLRRRGPALEAALSEVLAPPGRDGAARKAIRTVLRASGADYGIALGADRRLGEGLVSFPRQGPRLTWRSVNATVMPPLADWHLALGDIELL
jgi:GNAT superfamily N-acetyltransferase